MFQVGARLVWIAALAAVGMFLAETQIVVWTCACAPLCTAPAIWILARRDRNGTVLATLLSALDGLLIALALSTAPQASALGFVALIPCLAAASVSGARPSVPIVAAAVGLFAGFSIDVNGQPSWTAVATAVGVAVIGWLVDHVRVPPTAAVMIEKAADESPINRTIASDPSEIKDRFRSLKLAYSDLESRSEADHLVAELMQVRSTLASGLHAAIAAKLRHLTGAESVVVYTAAQSGNFVVRAPAGDIEANIAESAIKVNVKSIAAAIKSQADAALAALTAGTDRKSMNVLAKVGHDVVGMVAVIDRSRERAVAASAIVERLCQQVGFLLVEESRRAATDRQLKEAELLYELATATAGATTTAAVAKKVVERAAEIVHADHLSICVVESEGAATLAGTGISMPVLANMRFETGVGLKAWIADGGPEIVLHDVRTSAQVSAAEATRLRVGSYCVIGLHGEDGIIGYLAAGTRVAGALDFAEVEALRIVAMETSHALERLGAKGFGATRFVNSTRFHDLLASGATGSLVHLEPLQRAEAIERYGRHAVVVALRKFGMSLKSALPPDAVACKRSDGDYAVFLPDVETVEAAVWANRVVAEAALIGILAADGITRAPLSVRSKVAEFGRQSHEVFTRVSA